MTAHSNTGTVLDRILEARRAEVDHRKRVLPETALKYGVKAAPPVRDFASCAFPRCPQRHRGAEARLSLARRHSRAL